MTDLSALPLPAVTPITEPFWTGGADGQLLIQRCTACDHWIHPPAPICPSCLSTDVGPQPVSGRGVIASFTINWQPWLPNLEVPYALAIVELPEQAGLRLTSRIVDCAIADIAIGQTVSVIFEPHGDVWLPLFRPVP